LGIRNHPELGLQEMGEDTREGLLRWCEFVDGSFEKTGYTQAWLSYTPQVRQLFQLLPCYSDFFRYVQWHNMAIEAVDKLQVPSHIVHYEDYSERYNESVAGLLDFLELRQTHDAKPFETGKTYPFFRRNETLTAARLIQSLASPKCWELLRRYFEAEEFDDAIEWDPKQREVVWLISLPGSVCIPLLIPNMLWIAFCLFFLVTHLFLLPSIDFQGSNSILKHTKFMTDMTTATNFGHEALAASQAKTLFPVRKQLTDGPFLINPKVSVWREKSLLFHMLSLFCSGHFF